MATVAYSKNRYVKATFAPKPPIRSAQCVKVQLSRFSSHDGFISDVQKSLHLDTSLVVLEDGDCRLNSKEFVAAAVDYCVTGNESLPIEHVEYDKEQGIANVKLAITIDGPAPDDGALEDLEGEVGGPKKTRGGKKGKRAPWLATQQRILPEFMPLTEDGKHLMAGSIKNDVKLLRHFNRCREAMFLQTKLEHPTDPGLNRRVFMDRLNKRLAAINAATNPPQDVENPKEPKWPEEDEVVQAALAERNDTAAMACVLNAANDIHMGAMRAAGGGGAAGMDLTGDSDEDEDSAAARLSRGAARPSYAAVMRVKTPSNVEEPPRFTKAALDKYRATGPKGGQLKLKPAKAAAKKRAAEEAPARPAKDVPRPREKLRRGKENPVRAVALAAARDAPPPRKGVTERKRRRIAHPDAEVGALAKSMIADQAEKASSDHFGLEDSSSDEE